MKESMATIRVVMIVSLALMLFFWYLDPDSPPSTFEVNLWVGVVAFVVTSLRRTWTRVRATRASC